MPLTIVGTVPYEGFPLIHGACSLEDDKVRLGGERVPVLRGTPALIAAACLTAQALGLERPLAILAGDIGRGDGSRQVYAYLCQSLQDSEMGLGDAATDVRTTLSRPPRMPMAETSGLPHPKTASSNSMTESAKSFPEGQADTTPSQFDKNVEPNSIKVMVFHYLQPDVDWHNRILMKLDDLPDRPLLVADAGYMYVAKMSGFAASYDLFTPDVGEMAFLADESAPHPFYTRGFLLQDEDNLLEQIKRAYRHENAARYLLVKGRRDLVASAAGVLSMISEPCVENMEPIGGTGDSLTGIVAALIHGGKAIPEAAALGASMNRFLGQLANPSPASSIAELLRCLPDAVRIVLSGC